MNHIETLLRPDQAVHVAFGLEQCAHSSIIQETLDTCLPDTVKHLQEANGQLYRRYGQALRQNFSQSHLGLDIDLPG